MGTRLRNLVKSKKKEILPGLTREGVDGKGRLSEKNINILQNDYGMAIRQNTNLYQMKKAIGATLFHCSDLKEEVRQQFCPQSIHSWCKYQSDKLTGLKTLVLFCVQCCVCRKRLSSPRCRSELSDSAWVVIVPGQKKMHKNK